MLNKSQVLQLDAVQGGIEQRSETYQEYVERVAQSPTQQCAKSTAKLAALLSGGCAVQELGNG